MYDEAVIQYFLENQMQLFKENVAESPEEAEEFLEDCMAVVCKNIKEVRAYFEDEGADINGMSNAELAEAEEVFAIPDGRYLIVEAQERCFWKIRCAEMQMSTKNDKITDRYEVISVKQYDVIIIGAGPSGIFCAYELIHANKDLKI